MAKPCINITLIISILTFLTSCKINCTIIEGRHKIELAKSDILCKCHDITRDDTIANEISRHYQNKYKFLYCALAKKKNGIGIYQYWPVKSSFNTNNFMILTEDSIVFDVDTRQMENFMAEKKFENIKMKRIISEIESFLKNYKNKTDSF